MKTGKTVSREEHPTKSCKINSQHFFLIAFPSYRQIIAIKKKNFHAEVSQGTLVDFARPSFFIRYRFSVFFRIGLR